MKTFDEAVGRYTDAMPSEKESAEIAEWIATARANPTFVRQMRVATAGVMLITSADPHPRAKLQAFLESFFVIGMMCGIDMEKPDA